MRPTPGARRGWPSATRVTALGTVARATLDVGVHGSGLRVAVGDALRAPGRCPSPCARRATHWGQCGNVVQRAKAAATLQHDAHVVEALGAAARRRPASVASVVVWSSISTRTNRPRSAQWRQISAYCRSASRSSKRRPRWVGLTETYASSPAACTPSAAARNCATTARTAASEVTSSPRRLTIPANPRSRRAPRRESASSRRSPAMYRAASRRINGGGHRGRRVAAERERKPTGAHVIKAPRRQEKTRSRRGRGHPGTGGAPATCRLSRPARRTRRASC